MLLEECKALGARLVQQVCRHLHSTVGSYVGMGVVGRYKDCGNGRPLRALGHGL